MSKDKPEASERITKFKDTLEKLAAIKIESADKVYLLHMLEDVSKMAQLALDYRADLDGRVWVTPTEQIMDKVGAKFFSTMSCRVSNDLRDPDNMAPAVLLNIWERQGRGKYICVMTNGHEEAVGAFHYCVIAVPKAWVV